MKSTILFTITMFVSIGLFVGGFFVPPMGTIDGSVLKAGGILLAFGAFAQVPLLLQHGTDFKLQHGNTTLSVNNPDMAEEEEEDDEDDD